jgi:hypothetical protein
MGKIIDVMNDGMVVFMLNLKKSIMPNIPMSSIPSIISKT